jgi:hypothetical protein
LVYINYPPPRIRQYLGTEKQDHSANQSLRQGNVQRQQFRNKKIDLEGSQGLLLFDDRGREVDCEFSDLKNIKSLTIFKVGNSSAFYSIHFKIIPRAAYEPANDG